MAKGGAEGADQRRGGRGRGRASLSDSRGEAAVVALQVRQ